MVGSRGSRGWLLVQWSLHNTAPVSNVTRSSFEIGFYVSVTQVAKCLIKVELVNDNFTELRGEIGGPADTPYEGGNFVLEIKIPETYPFNPPKVSGSKFMAIALVSIQKPKTDGTDPTSWG